MSRSAKTSWIEIVVPVVLGSVAGSRSAKTSWIEIVVVAVIILGGIQSRSAKTSWIEILRSV